MVIISEEAKRRILGTLPCTNQRDCEGPPKCYAYHGPREIGGQSNLNSQTNNDGPASSSSHSEDEDLRIALEESLKDSNTGIHCQFCKQTFNDIEELQLHQTNECRLINNDGEMFSSSGIPQIHEEVVKSCSTAVYYDIV